MTMKTKFKTILIGIGLGIVSILYFFLENNKRKEIRRRRAKLNRLDKDVRIDVAEKRVARDRIRSEVRELEERIEKNRATVKRKVDSIGDMDEDEKQDLWNHYFHPGS